MNPAVGKCKCPSCGDMADVCQNSKGKNRTYYIRCGSVFAGKDSDGCGVLQGRGPKFQNYVKQNAEWFKPDDHEAREVAAAAAAAEAKGIVAEHAHKPPPRPEPAPVKTPEPEKQSSSWFF